MLLRTINTSRSLFEVYSGMWFECTTLHSFAPRSPQSQRVVTPAAPDGLLVDLWGPVVGIHCELLTCEVWAVAEFVDAELIHDSYSIHNSYYRRYGCRVYGLTKYEARHLSAVSPFIIRLYRLLAVRRPSVRIEQHIARVFNAATDKRLTGEFTGFQKTMATAGSLWNGGERI